MQTIATNSGSETEFTERIPGSWHARPTAINPKGGPDMVGLTNEEYRHFYFVACNREGL